MNPDYAEKTEPTDFPNELLKKLDITKIDTKQTFGNDTCVSNKKFRPSFAVSEGDKTIVLQVSSQLVSEIIIRVNTSPENI